MSLDLDLDARPDVTAGGPTPPQPRRSLPSVLLLAGLVGMTSAGAVQAATRTAPPPPAPRIAVTVELRTALLDPVPTGVLDVTIDNRDAVPVTVRGITTSGPGVAGEASTPSGRGLGPGESRTIEVRVPLRCGRLADDSGPPQVVVSVTAPGRVGHGVTAVPSGRPLADGLCATATSVLPPGWNHPVLARGFRDQGESASVLFAGLPSGVVDVLAVYADTSSVPILGAQVKPDGTGSLTLARPAFDCRALPGQRVLPAGLGVVTRGTVGRPLEVYLPVGPDLSRWLLAGWRADCPQQPEFRPARVELPTGIDIHAND